MTRVEFSILWLVGLVYYFVTAPRDMTPFPVAVGWIIIGTTLFALVVLSRRFPLFGWFMLGLLSGLMGGGRHRWCDCATRTFVLIFRAVRPLLRSSGARDRVWPLAACPGPRRCDGARDV